MPRIFIGLGSNLDQPIRQLNKARQLIEQQIGAILNKSGLYESEAWGLQDQDNFVNAVIEVHSLFPPHNLLQKLLAIEAEMGRIREEKWGPRLIDLDLLFYGQLVLEEKDLILPHPHLQLRNFVLIPMLEIAPEWQHPVLEQSIEELYWNSPDKGEVYFLNKNWPVD